MTTRIYNPIFNNLGIVLSRKRHLEKDLRLHLFLKNQGKVVCTIKGGQGWGSKLKALQEPFTLADFQIFLPLHAVAGKILGGKLIQSHHNLRKNLAAFGVACQLCELIEVLFPFRAPAPDIFDILRMSFEALQNSTFPRMIWLWFTVRCLRALGHGDKTVEVTAFVPPKERAIIKSYLEGENPSIQLDAISSVINSLERAQKFMENQLNEHLPRTLKTSGFDKILVSSL